MKLQSSSQMHFAFIFALFVTCESLQKLEDEINEKPYEEKLEELRVISENTMSVSGKNDNGDMSDENGNTSNENGDTSNENGDTSNENGDISNENGDMSNNNPDPCARPAGKSNFFPSPKIGASPISTFEDLWKITEAFIKNKVSQGQSQIDLRKSIRWRRNTVQLIIEIFQKVVSRRFVPDGVLYSARELMLCHFEGVTGSDDTQNEEVWSEVIPLLKNCRDNLTEMNFLPSYGILNDLVYLDDAQTANRIIVPEEFADEMPHLDLGIEVLWYIFSLSLGACYKVVDVTDRLMWATNYFQAFDQDFINPVVDKWETGFSQIQQSVMFGDFNVLQAMKNIRVAASGVYVANLILDRQLNRPMNLDLETVFENIKTGGLL